MTFKTRKGVSFVVAFCRPGGTPRLRCEAYVDTGDNHTTSELYATLESRRGEIEGTFGEKLEWSSLEKRRASRVSAYFPQPILVEDEEQWPQAWNWAVVTMGRLRQAIELVLDET